MIVFAYIFLAIVIAIIAIIGADAAYKIARADYDRDMEREIADRIANAHIETRVVIEWING